MFHIDTPSQRHNSATSVSSKFRVCVRISTWRPQMVGSAFQHPHAHARYNSRQINTKINHSNHSHISLNKYGQKMQDALGTFLSKFLLW